MKAELEPQDIEVVIKKLKTPDLWLQSGYIAFAKHGISRLYEDAGDNKSSA